MNSNIVDNFVDTPQTSATSFQTLPAFSSLPSFSSFSSFPTIPIPIPNANANTNANANANANANDQAKPQTLQTQPLHTPQKRGRKALNLEELTKEQLAEREKERLEKSRQSRNKLKEKIKIAIATDLGHQDNEFVKFVTKTKEGLYNFSMKGLTSEEMKNLLDRLR